MDHSPLIVVLTEAYKSLVSSLGLGPYASFVITSYAITFLAIGGLVTHAILAERRQQRALAALEAQGIRRRSDAAKQKSAQ